MSRVKQIYYNAVFGGLGGLLAWLVVGSFATGTWNVWRAYAFVGSGVGLFIGAMVGVVEGAVVKRSLRQAMLGLLAGGLAGLLSGLLGLVIGERFFLWLQGGIVGRSLGWLLLGLFLGIGQGMVAHSPTRSSYGALGGTLAGLLGGVIYEGMTQLFLHQSDTVQMIVGGLGLILIGACLGSLIPAINLQFAKLKVKTGERQDMEVTVMDNVTLGSYDGCQVYLPGDPGIASKHAQVYRQGGAYRLRDLSSGQSTTVGGRAVPAGGEVDLKQGDTIRLGHTELQLV